MDWVIQIVVYLGQKDKSDAIASQSDRFHSFSVGDWEGFKSKRRREKITRQSSGLEGASLFPQSRL